MDKTDIEILLFLKKDRKFHDIEEMELDDNLPDRKELLERLKILMFDEFLVKRIINYWPYYMMTPKGLDLIWKGDLGLQIVRLLYNIGKCSNADLEHFLDFSHDEIQNEIKDLRYARNTIRRKDELDNKKIWVLTDDVGKDIARNLCEGLDIMKGVEEGKKKADLESMISNISSITTKKKDHGLFDKTWKKIVAVVGGIGIVAGTIISLLDLWDRMTGTLPGSKLVLFSFQNF